MLFSLLRLDVECMTALDYASALMLSGPGKPELTWCYYPAAILPEAVDRLLKSADQEGVL